MLPQFVDSSSHPCGLPDCAIDPSIRTTVDLSEADMSRFPENNAINKQTENRKSVAPTSNNPRGRRYAPIAPSNRVYVVPVRPRRRHLSPIFKMRAFHPLATLSPWSGLFNCYRPITSSSAVAPVQSVAAVPAAAVVTTVMTNPEKVAKIPDNAAS